MELFQTKFFSGIGPDNMRNIFEEWIIFRISAAWVLFNFYLKQKQKFSFWSSTEYSFLISLHGRIWST